MLYNKLITDSSKMYAFRAYFKQLLETTKNVLKTPLFTEGFVKDKHTSIITSTFVTYHSVLAKRSELLKDESNKEL